MIIKFSKAHSATHDGRRVFLLIVGAWMTAVAALVLFLLSGNNVPAWFVGQLFNYTTVEYHVGFRGNSPAISGVDDDKELLRRAAAVRPLQDGRKKIAFMFLTPGPLPLSPFWERFFKGHEGNYSIYVHPHPSYNYSFPPDSAFHGRRIPSQEVTWGTISMVDAERRLVANALLDASNHHFLLLSDSCIPLFNYTTIHAYLIGANLSFLASFDDPRKLGRGRYNRQMWPTITLEQWRKGSQWFHLHRDLAVLGVADVEYYAVFRNHCQPPCYNDEHYFPTLVNILHPELIANRTVMWVDWSRGGPHPRRFGWVDVKVDLLDWIRFGSECEYNGVKTNVCFLFARKFLSNTIGQLIKIGPSILGF